MPWTTLKVCTGLQSMGLDRRQLSVLEGGMDAVNALYAAEVCVGELRYAAASARRVSFFHHSRSLVIEALGSSCDSLSEVGKALDHCGQVKVAALDDLAMHGWRLGREPCQLRVHATGQAVSKQMC